MNIHIRIGDKNLGGALANESKEMSSNIFLVELIEGDVIWLRCKEGGQLYTGAGNQNTFSGFLLSISA